MQAEDLARLQDAFTRAQNALMDAEPDVLARVPNVDVLDAIAGFERIRERVEAITEERKRPE